MNDTVLGALIGAIAVLSAQWLTHLLTSRERRAERSDIRRVDRLSQRARDLRDLGITLTDMVTASEEVIWVRLSTDQQMPRSDPRAIRVTDLAKRSRFLRLVIGDDQLLELAATVSSTASKLSDSSHEDVDKHRKDANQALRNAIDRIAVLIREDIGAA